MGLSCRTSVLRMWSRMAVSGVLVAWPLFVALAQNDTATAERVSRFLNVVSVATEPLLRQMKDLPLDAVPKILEFRKTNGVFKSLDQFRTAAGLTDEQLAKVSAPYLRTDGPLQENDSNTPTYQDSLSAPQRATPGKTLGKKQPGGPSGPGSKGKPAEAPKLDLEVQSDYYSILPGYDLSKVDDTKKKVFLDTINHERCTCGCTGETLAWCLVNDPGCPVVKARVKKVYTDTFGQPPPVTGQP